MNQGIGKYSSGLGRHVVPCGVYMLVGRQKISKNFMNYDKWYYKKLYGGIERNRVEKRI